MTCVVTVKSQTLGKVTDSLFSLSKPIWLPNSPSIPWSLRLQGSGFHTLLPSLNSPAQGAWLHFPYRTQPLWFSTPPFFVPLPCCSLSPHHDTAEFMFTLDSLSLAVFSLLSTIIYLAPPLHLRVGFPSFSCISFCHPVT